MEFRLSAECCTVYSSADAVTCQNFPAIFYNIANKVSSLVFLMEISKMLSFVKTAGRFMKSRKLPHCIKKANSSFFVIKFGRTPSFVKSPQFCSRPGRFSSYYKN